MAVRSLQVSAWKTAWWQMRLAGKVLLKRSARLLIRVKLTHAYVMQMLLRETAAVVQTLKSQAVTFANGWEAGVWRLQQLKPMCNNAVKMIPEQIPMMLAVNNNVSEEFSSWQSASLVAVSQARPIWMMASVAIAFLFPEVCE